MGSYGKELILDLWSCDPATFTRESIKNFFVVLCEKIDMVREDLHFWDDVGVPLELRETEPHVKGTSAIQFIRTSNITIHTLDLMEAVYLNIFSCKSFDEDDAARLSADWFKGKIHYSKVVARGAYEHSIHCSDRGGR